MARSSDCFAIGEQRDNPGNRKDEFPVVKKIVNRILVSIPVLIGVIFLIFLMLNLAGI